MFIYPFLPENYQHLRDDILSNAINAMSDSAEYDQTACLWTEAAPFEHLIIVRLGILLLVLFLSLAQLLTLLLETLAVAAGHG